MKKYTLLITFLTLFFHSFSIDVNYVKQFDGISYKVAFCGDCGYSIYKDGEFDFPPPENFMVSMMGNCAFELSWDMPSTASPAYYLIFQNGEQIDSITGTSYILDVYFSSYNEFYVVAGYIDPNGTSPPSNTVLMAIPGGYTVPYFEDFEYGCINWYSSPVVGNDNFYHCDTVSYEGGYSLAWYSETPGAVTKCGPQYITPVICADIFVSFYYKTPENNGDYDKLYLYQDGTLLAGPLEMVNEWTYFKTYLYDIDEDFNLDFKVVGDNGGGIFIDNYIVDFEVGIDESENMDNIRIFPNHVSSSLNVEITNVINNICDFEILSIEGQSIKHFNKIFNTTGRKTLSFDMRDLKSGVYLLKIISGDNISVRKFMIK